MRTSQITRRDGWTVARRDIFLTALTDGASVTAAARLAGPSTASLYGLRQRDAGFAALWAAASTEYRVRARAVLRPATPLAQLGLRDVIRRLDVFKRRNDSFAAKANA